MRMLWWWATGFAAVAVVAGFSARAGNETAINGVVGAGLCAVICFALGAIEGRP